MTARRCLTLLLSALLLAPASAQADFTETPTYDFKGEPSCLAPTGPPGEVAIGTTTGARLLQATRAGFVPAGEVKAGEGFTCGSIVARPSGAGVIAGTKYYGDSVVAVVRDPGGTWSEPLSVATREGWTPQTVVGAVSDRGDVVVAWLEERSRPENQIRVRLATRAPGQPFGPAKVVHTSTGMGYAQGIDAEVSATGEAVVTWTALDASAKGPPRVMTNVAIVAPDGTVGAIKQVELARSATPSLSVASDGRALIAYVDDSYVTFVERPPGGTFGAPVKLARVTDPAGGVAIARLHDSGAAAIAWSGNYLMQVRMATRPGLGGFRPPVTVAKGDPLPKDFDPFWFSPAFADLSGGIIVRQLAVLRRGPDAHRGRPRAARRDRTRRGELRRAPGHGPAHRRRRHQRRRGRRVRRPAAHAAVRARRRHARAELDHRRRREPLHAAPRDRGRDPARRPGLLRAYASALPCAECSTTTTRCACRSPAAARVPCARRSSARSTPTASTTRFSAGSGELRIYRASSRSRPRAAAPSACACSYGAPDSVDLRTRDAHRARAALLEAGAAHHRPEGGAARRVRSASASASPTRRATHRSSSPAARSATTAATRCVLDDGDGERRASPTASRCGRRTGCATSPCARSAKPACRHGRRSRFDDARGPVSPWRCSPRRPRRPRAAFGQVEPLALRGDDACVRTHRCARRAGGAGHRRRALRAGDARGAPARAGPSRWARGSSAPRPSRAPSGAGVIAGDAERRRRRAACALPAVPGARR